jgi:Adenosine-deaminase (editase) domain
MIEPPSKPPSGKKRALRYVESRRTGTCAFADRVAALSLWHYRRHVPESQRLPQTCLATILAAFREENAASTKEEAQQHLVVCAMGVGTKFLSQEVLSHEERSDPSNNGSNHRQLYGARVRDSHAEVLVRRAFRRYLGCCIEQLMKNEEKGGVAPISWSILECAPSICGAPTCHFRLRSNVTLHMYCSSTPCGNSTIKKFATLQKEIFCSALSEHQWPASSEQHYPIPLHSIPLGQCALLLKRDRTSLPIADEVAPEGEPKTTAPPPALQATPTAKKCSSWPIYTSTDWCPPGTTPTWSGEGQVHSCSDKLARWNCLGLQGALLSSLLTQPLYLTTVTVGRKFSSHTCRRAVCCRLYTSKPPLLSTEEAEVVYSLHHPVVMGTGVYMDEDGVHDLETPQSEIEGATVRFHCSRSFASWWQSPPSGSNDNLPFSELHPPYHTVECIDGSTGLLYQAESTDSGPFTTNGEGVTDDIGRRSQICTAALVEQYWRIHPAQGLPRMPRTLTELRRCKRAIAPSYERAKLQLLTRHPVLKDWKRRRSDSMDDNSPVTTEIL